MHRLVLLLAAALLAAVSLAQSSGTKSGCEVCASTGDCSRAYRGEPGQFCGNWLDRETNRRPCCCPDDAVCKVSNYACNCGYAVSSDPSRDGGYDLTWLWWLLGSLALLLCCCGCCFMASKQSKYQGGGADMAIPVATPVTGGASSPPYGTASTTYPSAPTEPGYAAATPAYGRYYGQSRDGGGGGGGGMGAGTGAALGGTAGLVGGLLLGHSLADHGGHDGDAGGFDGGGGGFDGGGGGGGGGGGTFAGDF
ncbi:hypothetical protein PHYSODRAFT_305843 [Phytophthora sojae]|uniref:Uncharacterized protein n=1 Tax=Phytophthora sojae (strain P6497) TaxID=1094619 RepID=G5A6V3_PHYSP|nr:hypothetical protein PHYSODRAFT_305843 [Phytophthora sojae]EGZ09058.1 hypothetical protein PHYSODRAFT_305843 [Phytophthora sojae]|eukprot:XP_009535691.1 hypothetical protein PHYSODRAFT_305843 [Phytophthora sojae]